MTIQLIFKIDKMHFSAKLNVPSAGSLGGALGSAAGAVGSAAGQIAGDLPFPLCPGKFWAEGLKAIYGPGHVLLGVSPNPVFTTGDGQSLETGPLLSGLIFSIGAGVSSEGEFGSVQVKLALLDLKMINLTANVAIEYDQEKKGQDCTLVTLDPAKVFAKFVEFADPLNWPSLISEFTENPIKFYERNIEIFYPAGIDLSLNVRATIGGLGEGLIATLGKRSLVNREEIRIKCGNTPKFPPTNNVGFNPENAVELVEEGNPDEVVARLEEIETLYAHVFVDERICQAVVASTLTFDFIREKINEFNEFFNVPSWP